ncbi:bifunctional diguanylate cyclase/phosphodiesterase [Exiguobacterium sp. Leaf187]|uniref:bifunctional diguanylate cyclase/phosphodiesterase n=2 Tax=unclassified Exiguobacterium TaxID=2644629 RepID=UPI000A97E19D|nr:EAL domain-containing protein [Exiguobacterium sp. Leaf187]
MPTHTMHSHTDFLLITLSYLIAATSAYIAIELAGRVKTATNRSKHVWLIAGGSILGLGIWSMHFVAMLGHGTLKDATYSFPLVFLSVIIAMIGCILGFYLVSRQMSRESFVLGGFLMGSAIAGMHYVGIAALQGMTLQYHLGYVLLSILIAIAASWTALWIGFFSRYAKQQMMIQTKVFFAFVMGIAIFGMHHVGMLGLKFRMIPSFTSDQVIEPTMLLTLVSVVTLFLFIVFFASVLFDLQLRKRDLVQATILESTEDGVVTTNPDGTIQYANSLFYHFFPERHLYLTEHSSALCLDVPNHTRQILHVDKCILEVVNHPLKGENLNQTLWFFRNITDQVSSQRQLEYLAFHDRLTDLPNRDKVTLFIEEQIKQAIPISCLALSVDRWRFLSDMLGHQGVESLILQIAERLQSVIHEKDVLARLDSSEFLVILSDERSQLATQKAEKCYAALSQPFDIDGTVITLTMRAGISHYPEDTTIAQELIEYAKLAMHASFNEAQHTIKEFKIENRNDILRTVQIEKFMTEALETEAFELVYQPKIMVATEQMIGVEVLARWTHDELGFVSPAEFIPVAENTGAIHALGDWVLRTACLRWVAWQDVTPGPFSIAVNVSPLQFASQKFLMRVEAILAETGMDPMYLELEITESAALSYETTTYDKLARLQELGIRVSLDDFGTGYSSFKQLRSLPIQLLKIDRSFISSLFDGKNQQAIVQSMIQLGHNLEMEVLIEGVETIEQADWLAREGCDYFQGYYFSRPLKEEDLFRYLRMLRSNGSA